MGLDLNFWKYKEGVNHNDRKVYETACCDGEIFDGLEYLPCQLFYLELFQDTAKFPASVKTKDNCKLLYICFIM